jgi:quinol monooxygenase YgiN
MAPLDVVAVITAKQGSDPLVEAALKELTAASRTDRGCLAYDLFVSASAPETFITIERWASQEDIDAHMASPHIAKVVTVAGEHFDGFPAIHTLRSLEDGSPA